MLTMILPFTRSAAAEDRQAGLRQLLKLLLEERFPQAWLTTVADDDLRQVLLQRSGLVRLRTKVWNQLDAVARNERLIRQRVMTTAANNWRLRATRPACGPRGELLI